jgi:thiamine kinase
MIRLPELQSLIADIPAIGNATIVQELAGGPVSDSWLLKDEQRLLVLRVDSDAANRIGLDREAEIQVLQTVAAAGIGPRPVWADPGNGLLLTEYIGATVWQENDPQNPDRLKQLARTLRVLHELSFRGQAFQPAKAAHKYATGIGSDEAFKMAELALTLEAQLAACGQPPCLCHNDLVHTNIIGSGPVHLIDWEYAAMGDPLFDLAIVVRHHKLSDRITQAFLIDYMGEIDAETEQRFMLQCQLYDVLSDLWYRFFSL